MCIRKRGFVIISATKHQIILNTRHILTHAALGDIVNEMMKPFHIRNSIYLILVHEIVGTFEQLLTVNFLY